MNKEKIKKLRKTLLPLSIVLLIIPVVAIFGLLTTMFRWDIFQSNDVSKYNKADIISAYSGDIDGNLAIFPDENIVTEKNSKYTSRFSTGVFDTDATMILECKFSREQFEQEIVRLKNLKMIIRSGAKEFTNKVLYDDNAYNYPAYITIDGFGNTYEYALTDSDNYKIIYVYLAYPDADNFEWKDYLKKDL